MARKKKEKEEEKVVTEGFNYKALVTFIIVSTLIVLSVGKFGNVGTIINNFFSYLIGHLYLIVLISVFVVEFIETFLKRNYKFNIWFYIGVVLLDVSVVLLYSYIVYSSKSDFGINDILDVLKSIVKINDPSANFGGGVIGSALYCLTYESFSNSGTIVILVVLFALSAILIVPLGVYKTILSSMKDSSVKVASNIKEKHKLNKERLEQERIKKQRAEEDRKLRLAEEMSRNYKPEVESNDDVVIEDTHTEKVENKSKFAKTFFIDDSVSNKKNSSASVEKTEKQEKNVGESTVIKKVSRSKGAYHLPPLSLLEKISGKPTSINKTSAEIKGKRLIETLQTFDIESELVNTHIGPSVTKFEVKPHANIKVNRIMNIQDNIKMELSVKSVRIEAPIPGRNAVGVEIPNAETVPVRMFESFSNLPTNYKRSKLMFALGKDLMGKPVYCELNKMPHLLIGGATGSGKSVCINSIIISFLLNTNPDDVKLVLIDPKKVEFTQYNDIPHLLWPVITDSNMASLMLKKAVLIMEDRYDTFSTVGVRDIFSYNEFVEKHNATLKGDETPLKRMPNIVIIIDELADLMVVARKDVELQIQRLTQLSRACGMHLIVATQRPSTDVITGLIKSNIPSRISFAVSSAIDSRTILDSTGAEKLLGNGDMLYFPQGETAPIRAQGTYVSDKEIMNVTSFVKKEASPEYEDSYFQLLRNEDNSGSFAFAAEGGNTKDSLYDEVVEYVKSSQKASVSLLQRKFGIGYNRSARIIDQLEENGIIGPSNGSKPREVYIKNDD